MITPEKLRDEHETDFGGRPAAIRARRAAIREYCGLTVPRSLAAIPDWYDRHKSTMTKRLNAIIDDALTDGSTDDGNRGDQ